VSVLTPLAGVADVDVWALDAAAASARAVRTLIADALQVEPDALVIERTCSRCGRGGHGKPRLAGAHRGALDWSVTRAGDVALVAISRRGPVGVDVERIRPVRDPVGQARRFLGLHAAEQVAGAPPDERDAELLRLWTHAEARLKAAGVGVAGLAAGARAHGSWASRDLAAPAGFVAALAVRA
jgi:4'-phosphopantetheinyl transferase